MPHGVDNLSQRVNDDAHRDFEYVRYELDITRRTRTAHPHCTLAFTGEPQGGLGTQ